MKGGGICSIDDVFDIVSARVVYDAVGGFPEHHASRLSPLQHRVTPLRMNFPVEFPRQRG